MNIVWLMLSFLPLQFQQPAQSTPEAAVTAYYASFSKLDWHGCTKLMSQPALDEMKKAFLAIAHKPEAQKTVLALLKKQSMAEVDRLSGAQIVEGVLAAILPENGPSAPFLKQMKVDVLGHVNEGDTAHVVIRMRMPEDGDRKTNATVQSVDKIGNQWWLRIPSEIMGGLNTIVSRQPNR